MPSCVCALRLRPMLRRVRWPTKGARGRRVSAYAALLSCLLLLLWLLCCFLSAAPVDGGEDAVAPPRAPGGVFARAPGGGVNEARRWETPRGGASEGGLLAGGGQAPAVCQASVCRFCDEMRLNNAASVLHPAVLEYLRRHVLIGVVTGAYERFFRVDVGLCTWLGHVPAASLFVFTDAANTSAGRHGTWVESDTAPAPQRGRRGLLRRTGYSVGWLRAQHRFFHAIGHLAGLAGGAAHREVRWAIVMDDDSVLDLHALVRFLHRQDLHNVAGVAAAVRDAGGASLLQERCNRRADSQADDVAACLSLPERWNRLLQQQGPIHEEDFLRPGGAALQVGSASWNATTHALLDPATIAALTPQYLGDRGWGGAGHFMNLAALRSYAQKGEETCVRRFLIGGQLPSDAALYRCIPLLGIQRRRDAALSHCQARYLRHRLLDGELVSMHAKRDMVPPKYLALWRMGLYYQVLYHHNRTAYDLLMRVGACAYGYSCKLRGCGVDEDAAALSEFARLSGNATRMPPL
ncbi:uncharacterized protein Tco025E_00801 [Trypanosoma conorhini]|uniref:Uncharacterized protein n=1 Tax=Trypanosoma conorhini TaxID=83891 RepID=A0A422QAK4_9TRYP|nr:uncharacterized protein Tco025E_00801 [Trypanosoma conorhini]RNF26935.1 hypothetical protein Tco025E_00801 [Trypanosoma conorhini]